MSQKGPLSTSELLLYQYPGDAGLDSISPPCQKIHLVLRRMELPYFVVDLRSPLAVKHVTPSGRVPVLQVGDRRIGDSVAIVDALEEMNPERALGPAEPLARAVDRAWEHFANDHLYWLAFYFRWMVPDNANRMLEALVRRDDWSARFALRYGLLPTMRSRAKGQGIGRRTPEEVLDRWRRSLAVLEDGLAGGPFLQGRATPARGDFGVAALLAQVPYRDTMSHAHDVLRTRGALLAHVARTFQACRTNVPPGFTG